MLDEWLRRYSAFYVSLINTCKKNTPPPIIKNFMEIGVDQKELFIPPQNILEGNGVVFGNFTFNNLCLKVFTFY